MPNNRRPDPTTLETGGAVAVLTERIAGVQDTVDKIAETIETLPDRVTDLEEHDREQDDLLETHAEVIKGLQKAYSDALAEIRGVTRFAKIVTALLGGLAALLGVILAVIALADRIV